MIVITIPDNSLLADRSFERREMLLLVWLLTLSGSQAVKQQAEDSKSIRQEAGQVEHVNASVEAGKSRILNNKLLLN